MSSVYLTILISIKMSLKSLNLSLECTFLIKKKVDYAAESLMWVHLCRT